MTAPSSYALDPQADVPSGFSLPLNRSLVQVPSGGRILTKAGRHFRAVDPVFSSHYQSHNPSGPVLGSPMGVQRLRRREHAGAQPLSWIGVLCELQRDWIREATNADVVRIRSANGGSWATEIALKQFASNGMKTG